MIETLTGAAQPRRNFYGRRHGKALRPTQRRHLEELLPRLAVPGVTPGGAVDPAALFPGAREIWLEIGFGGGEHLAATAAAHPDIGLLGCEPFVNGVAMTLRQIELGGAVGNVRLHVGDARDLVDLLPDGALGRVYLLYPDPWPKARHRDRRFTSPENLTALARVMAPGAELRLATDIADYVEHSLASVAQVPAFERGAAPIDAPWPGWHRTRYEAKALTAGRRPNYLIFVRR
ncbi:MAG: tRNA (guanine(46)-N(7))-methyltransferase TrmB [Amaricoccus sp.]|uniref:tRNA (guanine(46)-N(7))-methyltransferase TrmB n=1 Tax=Amaricoccus sp. TaxID=1872485 RepID=UPI003315FB50